jgi:hypothetical protein
VEDHGPRVLSEARYDQDHCSHTKGTVIAIQFTDSHYYEAVVRGYHWRTRLKLLSMKNSGSGGGSSSSSTKQHGKKQRGRKRQKRESFELGTNEDGAVEASDATTNPASIVHHPPMGEDVWAQVSYCTGGSEMVNLPRINYFVVDKDEALLHDTKELELPMMVTGGTCKLGDRASIRWKDGNRYVGTINKIRRSDARFFHVVYDDGDVCWHNIADLTSHRRRKNQQPRLVVFQQLPRKS